MVSMKTIRKRLRVDGALRWTHFRLGKFLLSREATYIPILLTWKCYSFCVVLSVTSSLEDSSLKIGRNYFHIYVDNCHFACP